MSAVNEGLLHKFYVWQLFTINTAASHYTDPGFDSRPGGPISSV